MKLSINSVVTILFISFFSRSLQASPDPIINYDCKIFDKKNNYQLLDNPKGNSVFMYKKTKKPVSYKFLSKNPNQTFILEINYSETGMNVTFSDPVKKASTVKDFFTFGFSPNLSLESRSYAYSVSCEFENKALGTKSSIVDDGSNIRMKQNTDTNKTQSKNIIPNRGSPRTQDPYYEIYCEIDVENSNFSGQLKKQSFEMGNKNKQIVAETFSIMGRDFTLFLNWEDKLLKLKLQNKTDDIISESITTMNQENPGTFIAQYKKEFGVFATCFAEKPTPIEMD